MKFTLKTNLTPTGDQPDTIGKLTNGVNTGKIYQVLLGVTGSGKTFTMANVIQNIQRPTLIISHNKTLAAQLYQEFKEFFPENAVHYFVSYYDYYQPEAYIPHTDTYIEKDAKINEEIDRLRHATTQSLLTRNDVIVVASVSCIYGIGEPEEYGRIALDLAEGQRLRRQDLIRHLARLRYERNDILPYPGTFRVRGERIGIYPIIGGDVIEIDLAHDLISEITYYDQLRDHTKPAKSVKIFPAKHFVTPHEKLEIALQNIEAELEERLHVLRKQEKIVEAKRLETRTRYDIEMLRETEYCTGIENYSRHLSFRKPGEPPATLLDYFSFDKARDKPRNFLLIIDESHMSIPQIRGMYNGDRARKEALVEYGFRLPSALDNRPLKFREFEKKVNQIIYVSATPSLWELDKSRGNVVEQLTRPTGILDPTIEIHHTKGQIPHLTREIKKRVRKHQRVLVTVITKRLAEDLAEFLREEGIKVEYLHSEIKTLERPEILRKLRLGVYDVVVGVNLLREGLDLPEVSLVAILDADKEGFLRNDTTLIQTIGRAARHIEGHVIMYADTETRSMQRAIAETKRRRKTQEIYNREFGITPTSIEKGVRAPILPEKESPIPKERFERMTLEDLKKEMMKAAENLEFEKAAFIRDKIKEFTKRS